MLAQHAAVAGDEPPVIRIRAESGDTIRISPRARRGSLPQTRHGGPNLYLCPRNSMLELLERQRRLTANQWKILVAAILGDMLDFFDCFLIGYVLAFIVHDWNLTYGQSAMILLAAGVGAVPGAFFWSWMADRIGRRDRFRRNDVVKAETLGRLVGHAFGAVGAAATIDAILTAIDPPLPAQRVGEVTPVELLAGGLSSLGFLGLGA